MWTCSPDGLEKPLLILSVLHSLEPGGVERDLLRFTKAWRDHGLDARIALGRWEGRLIEEAPDVPISSPAKGPLARIETETLWMALKLPEIVRQVPPGCIVLPSNGLMAVAATTRLQLGRDCPPIVLRPSNDLKRADTSWLARFVHRRFLRAHSGIYAAIVGMAPPVREEIMLEMGAKPEQAGHHRQCRADGRHRHPTRCCPRRSDRAITRGGISSASAGSKRRRISTCCSTPSRALLVRTTS